MPLQFSISIYVINFFLFLSVVCLLSEIRISLFSFITHRHLKCTHVKGLVNNQCSVCLQVLSLSIPPPFFMHLFVPSFDLDIIYQLEPLPLFYSLSIYCSFQCTYHQTVSPHVTSKLINFYFSNYS